MRKAGEVVFADVMMLPSGRSKGCGIVEYRTPEEAQRAIQELTDTMLMGRQIFVREDREDEPVFKRGPPPMASASRQIFVRNLPLHVSWQDLKDIFRRAGAVIRADVKVDAVTGRSRGVGTVIFETTDDARRAISMYDRYDLEGCILEVRE
ncbi:hypothetical protein BZG36_03640, partial [Bifiguratus adelaidae]